jgi:hypothetical protein
MRSSIFQWPDGAGWLVLSGGGNFRKGESEGVDTRMILRGAADGALAYVWAASDLDTAEHYLTYIADLGGRSGYPVDIVSEDDASLNSQLGEAGLIVVGDGNQGMRLYNALHGPAIQAILAAYLNGALIMGVGVGAEVFGSWFLRGGDDPRPGFGWLSNALLQVSPAHPTTHKPRRELFQREPLAYSVELGQDSALALGPEGQVELWGKRQIAVSLGQGYGAQK